MLVELILYFRLEPWACVTLLGCVRAPEHVCIWEARAPECTRLEGALLSMHLPEHTRLELSL